jgi:hypothetical protein
MSGLLSLQALTQVARNIETILCKDTGRSRDKDKGVL